MLKGKYIDQSFTPQFQSIMNHRGEKTHGYEIGYEINLYINFIPGERSSLAWVYTLQRPHCPDAHIIAGSSGSDRRQHGAAQNRRFAAGIRPLYMGGNGVHPGINDHDSYRGQALRPVRAQVVLSRGYCHLPARLCACWSLADDEPVHCVTIINQVPHDLRRCKEEHMSEWVVSMSRKHDAMQSHAPDCEA